MSDTIHLREARGTARPHSNVVVARGLGRTLFIAFLTLTIIPLVIVAAVGTALTRTMAMSEANTRLSAVADLKTQAIHDWVTERNNELRSLLVDQTTADLLQKTLREPENATFKQSLAVRLVFDQTERDAEREHTINRVTSLMRNAQSVDQVLSIAVQELRLATRASRSIVEITPGTPRTSSGNGSGDIRPEARP